MRKKIGSGAKWEDIVGYSRLIQVGNIIEIAGTTAVNGGVVMHKGNAFAQAKFIFELFDQKLKEVGASLEDVVRTRIFVKNIDDWEKIGEAHGLFFRSIKPVTTLLEVSAFVDPDILVEIEATAIKG